MSTEPENKMPDDDFERRLYHIEYNMKRLIKDNDKEQLVAQILDLINTRFFTQEEQFFADKKAFVDELMRIYPERTKEHKEVIQDIHERIDNCADLIKDNEEDINNIRKLFQVYWYSFTAIAILISIFNGWLLTR